jgi:5'-3' exonuclease
MKRILVIDYLNLFLRNYIVDPSLSSNGQPIGGLKGSIKSLQKLVRESKPSEIVICWDGLGGSKKRKTVKKDYKAGRKPIRLNRSIRNLSENEELQNKVWQMTRVSEFFNEMPVIQLIIDNIEADDIIGYICTSDIYSEYQKVIVSSDKDFYQLLSEDTVLHRPVQKETLNKNNIVEKFGIHPNNFALARAMAGDRSDNISGIPTIGLPTVAKRFPFLKEEKSYLINELVEYCEQQEGKLKIYDRVLENEDLLKENYNLMQLYVSNISPQNKRYLRETIENFKPEFNKTEFLKMSMKDGFGEYNFENLFQNFNRIISDHRK